MDKISRIKEVVDVLHKASIAYYRDDNPVMSDKQYDDLYDELEALEKETGVILAGSPTQKVQGEVVDYLPKVKHSKSMLSADKTKNLDDIKKFIGNKEVVQSWKLDGLTVVATYKEGKLVQAVTRGNGTVGEDVTHTFKHCINIPLQLSEPIDIAFRGECVIPWNSFKKINETLDKPYSHPRNLAAGTLRQLDASIAIKRQLEYYVFDVVEGYDSGSLMNDYFFAASLGMPIVEHCIVTDLNVCYDAFNPEEFRLPVDGLIYKYNDTKYGKSLGSTQHHPLDMMALKWADDLYETTLTGIEWQTSRTGLINPVAIFEPVELEGTTVSRASVHNISIMEELELGVGDTIQVYKANMIIPQIAENLTRSGVKDIPKVCPVCGGPTKIRMENETKTLYCTNPRCQAKHVKAFALFASRDAMNIEGLSEATLEKFIMNGFIKDFTDIFHLERYEDEIKNMEGFGEKSYQNLQASIRNARVTTLPRLVYSLGIPNIGISNARMICQALGNDPERVMNAAEEELDEIQGVGEVIAKTFAEYFADEEHRDIFRRLLDEVEIPEEEAPAGGQNLAGINFVITGSVEHFANRGEVKEEIEKRGGKVTGSVTSKTNYLINNDVNSTSSKNRKARELGIPIISEEEFMKMLG